MAEKIKLGIIGLGAMGQEMLRVASTHPDFRATLAADPNEAAVITAAAGFPETKFSTETDTVVASTDVEAVYIAAPPKFHAHYAIAAFHAGKPVFCEKPLAVSIADGESMARAALDSGLVNAVNFALSDRNAVLEIERAIKAGELGMIREVDLQLTMPSWPRPFQREAVWLGRREQGGVVREVLSHFAYLSDRLFGSLETKNLEAAYPKGDSQASEIAAAGTFTAGGHIIRVTALTNVAAPERYEYTIYGTEKSYQFRGWGELYVSNGGAWDPIELNGPRGTEHSRLTTFAESIRDARRGNVSGSGKLPDFAAGLRVQRLVEGVLRIGSPHVLFHTG